MYRHHFEPLSFVFGLILVLVGVPFLIGAVDVFDIRWSWVGPVVPLAIGGALLLSGLRRWTGDAATDATPDDPI